MNITTASTQWATRPDDQRFLTLADLRDHVAARRSESWTTQGQIANVRAVVSPYGELQIECNDPSQHDRRLLNPTHWGFGQLAAYAKAPAAYLRTLPPELSAINLQWGLENNPIRKDALILAQSNGHNALRAITSQSYGRIWDSQVVSAVERMNQSGRWQIPSASYSTNNPKRATTLYASDRDVFIFMVDPNNPIEIDGETLFKGFIVWNSEVGSATFGIQTFLYRYVCDNRIIWDATEVRELSIKHSLNAPERFASEGLQYLRRYADESSQKAVEQIKRAKAYELPALDVKDGISSWLQSRGFTGNTAQAAVRFAHAEEGRARSLWDIVNGVTAYARTIEHTDSRVDLERKAGALMKIVAK